MFNFRLDDRKNEYCPPPQKKPSLVNVEYDMDNSQVLNTSATIYCLIKIESLLFAK